MGRGLFNVPKSRRGGGDYIRSVYLRDEGDSCRIRFLTEADDIFWAYFHQVIRGGRFAGWKICLAEEAAQTCDLCDAGDTPKLQFLAWAYEIDHFYTAKPERLESEPVRVGRSTLYRVAVSEPRLMRYAASHLDTSGIGVQAERRGTLLGRTYEWVRRGMGLDTTYNLTASEEQNDPIDFPDVSSLPNLEDVAFGRTESLDGAKEPPAQEPDLVDLDQTVGDGREQPW